jgi:hypothetical protein
MSKCTVNESCNNCTGCNKELEDMSLKATQVAPIIELDFKLENTFYTIFDQYKDYNGLKFTFIREMGEEDGVEEESGRSFLIRLENGKEIQAFLEEISVGGYNQLKNQHYCSPISTIKEDSNSGCDGCLCKVCKIGMPEGNSTDCKHCEICDNGDLKILEGQCNPTDVTDLKKTILQEELTVKKYKEINGVVLSCSVGKNAVIVSDNVEIVTSPVEKISMIWQNKLFFETENSLYVVTGTIFSLNTDKSDKNSLQIIYNKINTILLEAGITLDLTNPIPALKRGTEIRSFKQCEDYFEPIKNI